MYTQHYQPQHPILQQFEPSARCANFGSKDTCKPPFLDFSISSNLRYGLWKNGESYQMTAVQNWVELNENEKVYLAYIDLPEDPENEERRCTFKEGDELKISCGENDKKSRERDKNEKTRIEDLNKWLAKIGFTFMVEMGKKHYSEDYDLVIDTPQKDNSLLDKFRKEDDAATAKKKQFWRKNNQYDTRNTAWALETKLKERLEQEIKLDMKTPHPKEKGKGKSLKFRRLERYEEDLERITLRDVKKNLEEWQPALKNEVEVLINHGTSMGGDNSDWKTNDNILEEGKDGEPVKSTTNLNTIKGLTRGNKAKTWEFQIKRKNSDRDVPVVMKISLLKKREKKVVLQNPEQMFEFYYVLWPSKK